MARFLLTLVTRLRTRLPPLTLLPPVLAEAVVLAAPRPPPEHSPAPTKRSAHAGTSAPTCSGGVVSVLRRCLTAFRGGPRLPAGSTRCHALS